jgi:hypothetical protein
MCASDDKSKEDDKSKKDDTSGLALLIRKVEPEAKDIINKVLCKK